MNIKLLTEHHLEFVSLKKEAAQAHLSLHLSKCHIVGNHMSWLKYSVQVILGIDERKPVFGVHDQVRLKQACSATETS